MRITAVLILTIALGGSAAAAETDPFANPVKDCHPCRFSPGPGQPDFDLTFVFDGKGDNKALTALEVTPVGGKPQRLDTGAVPVAEFGDGFIIGTEDMNFDGRRDLSLITMMAATNAGARYWLYRPERHDFVPLRRVGDGGVDNALTVTGNRELLCHIHGSAVDHVDYYYRVEGDRAIAVRKEVQERQDALIVATTYDLAVAPARRLRRLVVGFMGASPERDVFLKQLEAASRRAADAYKAGDRQGAVAAVEPLLKDKYPDALGSGDNDESDKRLAARLNDYGFYLEEAGRPGDAVEILQAVIGLNADRAVAYLNLADAQYDSGDKGGAKANYAEYQKRMTAAGKTDKIPPRVADRAK